MNFEFPLYFKTTKTDELTRFYRYSDGNRVLEFDKFSISAHCGPYIMNTQEEFYSFISMLKTRQGIIETTKEDFETNLKNAFEFISNEGINPREYWSKEMIKANNVYLNRSE